MTKKQCVSCLKSKKIANKKKYCLVCSRLLSGIDGGRDLNREKVRIRFGHKCFKCGKKWQKGTRRLHVHHLDGLCGIKSRKYDNPKEILRLRPVCAKCHKSYIHPSKHREKLTSESDIQQVRQMIARGMSYGEAGRLLGISYAAMYALIKRRKEGLTYKRVRYAPNKLPK